MIAFVVLCVMLSITVLCITNRIADSNYIHKAMLYIDIFLCALITRNPDMTISARCGLYCRRHPPLFWFLLGKCLEALQKGHLEMAIAADKARAEDALKLLS